MILNTDHTEEIPVGVESAGDIGHHKSNATKIP